MFNTYKRVYTTRLLICSIEDCPLFNTYKRVYTTSYTHTQQHLPRCLIPIKEYIQQVSDWITAFHHSCLIPIKEYIQQESFLSSFNWSCCLIPIKEYIQQEMLCYHGHMLFNTYKRVYTTSNQFLYRTVV